MLIYVLFKKSSQGLIVLVLHLGFPFTLNAFLFFYLFFKIILSFNYSGLHLPPQYSPQLYVILLLKEHKLDLTMGL